MADNLILRVFFFQAEDGIRDHCVTGVQTCALPISAGKLRPELWETSRKCNHGPVNEIFFELRGGNGPPPRNLADSTCPKNEWQSTTSKFREPSHGRF